MASAIDEKKSCYCTKCKRTMVETQFYSSNNLKKYPSGKLPLCKKCITMHVDNWNPETYLWILQECDVPYVPEEWNNLLMRYGKDPSKVTGATIMGRYLSIIRLNQYAKFRWKDSEFVQSIKKKEIEETMRRQGFDEQQIAQMVETSTFQMPEAPLPLPPADEDSSTVTQEPTEDYFARQAGIEEELKEIEDQLSEEERIQLRLKWGKSYTLVECVQLEKLWNNMMESYDIQTAGHLDTLKLVCKTSLKANQLIDLGDVEGFQKMSRVYDSLMKSGKFTAAQNKPENGEVIDSIGELVALCEKDGFIPRYYIDEPMDKVDRTLQDLQSYTRSLVLDEMNLGNLIENAVKQIAIEKEKESDNAADAASDEEALENELFSENSDKLLTDEDFEALYHLEDSSLDNDEDYYLSLIETKEEDK